LKYRVIFDFGNPSFAWLVGRPMLFWVIDNLVFNENDTLWVPCHIDLVTG